MLKNFEINSPPDNESITKIAHRCPCSIQRMRNWEGPFCEQFRLTVFRIFCGVIYSPNLLLALPSFLDGVNLAVLCACANLHVRRCQRAQQNVGPIFEGGMPRPSLGHQSEARFRGCLKQMLITSATAIDVVR